MLLDAAEMRSRPNEAVLILFKHLYRVVEVVGGTRLPGSKIIERFEEVMIPATNGSVNRP